MCIESTDVYGAYSSHKAKQVYFSHLLTLTRQGVELVQSFSYFQLDPTFKHIR